MSLLSLVTRRDALH